jgi:LPS-assembly lipoprotein
MRQGLRVLVAEDDAVIGLAVEAVLAEYGCSVLLAGTTRVVATPAEAEAHLRVLQEEREKSVSAITASGRVYEYQLTLRVRYELLLTGREEPLIAPSRLETRRLISYSETAPTAKEAEEQLLYKDMQLDLGRQILRHVAAASKNAS